MKPLLCLLICTLLSSGVNTQIPDEDWGYVNVRQDANMFWWLYGIQAPRNRTTAPLVVWLQGGPGASGTGYGNFEEIGPLDVNLQPRKINWVQSANVLFIDNPVGTGYSYVTSNSAYSTTDEQIGADLVNLMIGFLKKYPSFQQNDFWIFCESYGGKMTTSFGNALNSAISAGKIKLNFKGVALGDSWISPISFVNTWADYLLATSEIDSVGYQAISSIAAQTNQAVVNGEWVSATNLWDQTENIVSEYSLGVDFYNILNRNPSNNKFKSMAEKHLHVYQTDPLTALMNGPIRNKLKIIPANVIWGGQSNNVFSYMATAFMQPIIDGVDSLLASGRKVVVYSGNLDLICCTPGTLDWIYQLKWPKLSNWNATAIYPLSSSSQATLGYIKSYDNFHFYEIFASGHMVPADQPEAAQTMLEQIIGKK